MIHTVGPVWHGGTRHEAERLAAFYHNSFELALQHGLRSIAFPAVSTGVYGYPKHEAVAIATAAMREYAPRFARIIACCHSAEDLRIYRELLAAD